MTAIKQQRHPAIGTAPLLEWHTSSHPVAYPDAVSAMEARVEAIRAGSALERVWLLEHPPIYTAGTSARIEDLLHADRFPVYRTGRGGQFTYHGPGQRVAYVMLDLERRGRDVRAFVHGLEEWLIRALARLGVTADRRAGRVGIWVVRNGADAKIAAIGVRVRRWVTFHGIAVNIDPELDHFRGIVPCGLAEYAVTSLAECGCPASMTDVDHALQAVWPECPGLRAR